MIHITLIIHFTLTLLTIAKCQISTIQERSILNTILDPTKYDPQATPAEQNNTRDPIIIQVLRLDMTRFEGLDELNARGKVEVSLKMEWVDKRLQYNSPNGSNVYLTLTKSSEIWTPIPIFLDALKTRVLDVNNIDTYTRVTPAGNVSYSRNFIIDVPSEHISFRFPFDTKECGVTLSNGKGYTTENLMFRLQLDLDSGRNGDDIFAYGITNSVGRKYYVFPGFKYAQLYSYGFKRRRGTDTYSCIRIGTELFRDYVAFLIKIHIPMTLLVLLGYLTLWIDPMYTTGRLTASMSTILVMLVGTYALNFYYPYLSSRTNSIHVWTGSCLGFALFPVIICILTIFTSRRDVRMNALIDTTKRFDMNYQEMNMETRSLSSEKSKKVSLTTKIDWIVRILYPIAFIAFALVYWLFLVYSPYIGFLWFN